MTVTQTAPPHAVLFLLRKASAGLTVRQLTDELVQRGYEWPSTRPGLGRPTTERVRHTVTFLQSRGVVMQVSGSSPAVWKVGP